MTRDPHDLTRARRESREALESLPLSTVRVVRRKADGSGLEYADVQARGYLIFAVPTDTKN